VIPCKQKGKYTSDYDCYDEHETEKDVHFPQETQFLITKVEEYTIWMTDIVEEKKLVLLLMNTP
jgi:hypothetical protein